MAIKSCLWLFLVVIPFLVHFGLKCFYAPIRGAVKTNSRYGEAEIIFDHEYGVPYVKGSTKEAVFYAQGFAHASDRLYELQLKRMRAAGRLSEVSRADP